MGEIGKRRWQISLRWLLISWAVLTVAGVVGRRVYLRFYPPPKYMIALYTSDPLTRLHLKNLLTHEGIPHSMGVFGCQLDEDTYDRAVELLRNAEKDARPTVLFSQSYNLAGSQYLVGDYRDRFEFGAEQRLDEILADGETTELTQILRAVATNDIDSYDGGKFPFVISVTGCRRCYLKEDGTFGLGYEVAVQRCDVWPKYSDIRNSVYQIYDEFRRVDFQYGEFTANPYRVTKPKPE